MHPLFLRTMLAVPLTQNALEVQCPGFTCAIRGQLFDAILAAHIYFSAAASLALLIAHVCESRGY